MSDKIISKRCSKCKETKPISEFFKASVNKDGFRNDCKTCCLKYKKEYRQTERGKAAEKQLRQTEKYKTYKRRYEQSEKSKTTTKHYNRSEKGRAKVKRYAKSEKGRKAHAAAGKRFKIRHPEQFEAYIAVNIAIKAGQLPRPDLLQCHYCPAQAKEYHHYKGYAPEHWLDVISVCQKCHNKIPKNPVKSVPSLTA